MRKAEILRRARRIRAIVADVDGVLTDGRIIYGPGALELKRFHALDGLGVVMARRAGLRVFLVSGRSSHAVRRRSRELGVDRLVEGATDKGRVHDILCREFSLARHEICSIGDDLPDIPLLKKSGLAVAVPDAPAEVRQAASFVTERRGGGGAFREVVEIILKARGKWEEALGAYAP